jgi:hypothetical protein
MRDGRRRAYIEVGAAPRPLPSSQGCGRRWARSAGIELIDIAPAQPRGSGWAASRKTSIVAVNGKPIESVEELQRQLSARRSARRSR